MTFALCYIVLFIPCKMNLYFLGFSYKLKSFFFQQPSNFKRVMALASAVGLLSSGDCSGTKVRLGAVS